MDQSNRPESEPEAKPTKRRRARFVVSHPVGHGFRVIEQTAGAGAAELRAAEALATARAHRLALDARRAAARAARAAGREKSKD